MQSIGSALLLALLITLAYVARAAWAPFLPCRRCAGTGERRRAFGGTRRCTRCAGIGERLRVGVRFWHYCTGRSW